MVQKSLKEKSGGALYRKARKDKISGPKRKPAKSKKKLQDTQLRKRKVQKKIDQDREILMAERLARSEGPKLNLVYKKEVDKRIAKDPTGLVKK